MITKVSNITVTDIQKYLRISELSNDDKNFLETIKNVAINFIVNYTGIPLSKTNSQGYILYYQYVDKSYKYYWYDTVSKVLYDIDNNLSNEDISNLIQVEKDIDDYSDFVIVVYVLCQDMYDNRTYYVDGSNINKVIQTILDMHSGNLL